MKLLASRRVKLIKFRCTLAATVNTLEALPPLRISWLPPSRVTFLFTVLTAVTTTVVGATQAKVALPPAARALFRPVWSQVYTALAAAEAAPGRSPAKTTPNSRPPSATDTGKASHCRSLIRPNREFAEWFKGPPATSAGEIVPSGAIVAYSV